MEKSRIPIGRVADFYQFLASCFLKEPNRLWMQGAKNALDKLIQAGCLVPELQVIRHILEKNGEDLEQAYYDLFFVPQSGRYVPPFESAVAGGYERKNGSYFYGNLAGKQEIAVGQYYAQMDFHWRNMDIYQPLKQIPFSDHIGFELAFVSFLCYQEQAWALEEEKAKIYRQWRQEFLSRHLGRWIVKYSELVAIGSELAFYKSVIELAAAFVSHELACQASGREVKE